MEYLTANTKALLNGGADHTPDPRARQGRDRDRRRRHRHRLRRHRDAPGLPEPHADRDPAEAAAGTRRRQSVAGVAEGLQARLRPGRSGREVRRGSARVSHDRQALRRRRRRAGSRSIVTVADRVGEEREGPVRAGRSAGHRARAVRRSSCCWRWASSGPSRRCSTDLGVERDARTQRQGRARPVTRRASRASSPPATAAAVRASSCGRSTKAAAPRASATAT